jgi:hypothetical protein
MLEESLGSGEGLDVESSVEALEGPVPFKVMEGVVESVHGVCESTGREWIADGWEDRTQERTWALLRMALLC